MDVFPVTWSVADGDGACRITAFGKRLDGASTCVHVRFTPYFYVKLPSGWSEARARLYLSDCGQRYGIVRSKSMLVRRKCLWGFQAEREHTFAQLAFETLAAHRKARYGIKDLPTYEAGVDPLVRFFHLRDIAPSSWVHVRSWEEPDRAVADVDVEIECALAAVGPSTVTARPPLVFASFDLECFSASSRFPKADNPEDCIINIATTFQTYGSDAMDRVVVCHRETAPVVTPDDDPVAIVWREREEQVIETWMKLVRSRKADVLVGYNTAQ